MSHDPRLQKNAKELASHGRHGDNRILHVSDEELKGLASLAPGGKLPKNPKTGQPEAFFFLPFLAGLGSLFGAAAPLAATTAAAVPAAAAGAGALGAGMAAGLGAATAPAIASAAAPAAAAGLSSLASTAPAALTAAAAPAASTAAGLSSLAAAPSAALPATIAGSGGVDSLLGGLTISGAPTTAAGLPTVTAALPAANPLPAAAASAPTSPLSALRHVGGAGSATPNFASNPAAAGARHVGGAGSSAANFATPAGSAASMEAPAATTGGGLMDMLKGIDPTMLMMGASALSGMGGGGGKKDDDEEEGDAQDYQYQGGEATFPGEDYEPGIDGEFRYYKPYVSKFASGGKVPELDRQTQINNIAAMQRRADGMDPGGGRGTKNQPLRMLQNKINAAQTTLFKTPVAAKAAAPAAGIPALMPKPMNMDFGAGVDANKQWWGGGAPSAGPDLLGGGPLSPLLPPMTEQNGAVMGYAMGGMVKGYAAGGIADLPQQGMQGMPASPLPQVTGGAPSLPQPVGVGDIPQSPYPKKQIGTPSKDDKDLIAQTVEAIKGNVAEPEPILLAFVKTFGEPALDDLVQRVQAVNGATQENTTDTVPAMLTPGEFVIKKDAVDKIGVDKLEKLNSAA